MTATMLRIVTIRFGNLTFNVLRPVARFDLNSYEQKDITLLAVHTTGQGGQGAPTPAHVGQQIRFTCSYR